MEEERQDLSGGPSLRAVIDDAHDLFSPGLGSPIWSLHYLFEIPGWRFQEKTWTTNFGEYILAYHHEPACSSNLHIPWDKEAVCHIRFLGIYIHEVGYYQYQYEYLPQAKIIILQLKELLLDEGCIIESRSSLEGACRWMLNT